MTDRVIVVGQRTLTEEALAQERAAAPGFEVLATLHSDAALLSRAEVYAGQLDAAQFETATSLRWNHLWTAGADADLSGGMRESSATLTTSAGNGGIPLAEHALLLMLMLDRQVLRWVRAQKKKSLDRFIHGELAKQTVGIIGMGAAGADLAAKCKIFHMRVLGVRNRPEIDDPAVDRMYGPAELAVMAAECDYLVVAAPLTEGTRRMVGAEVFQAMKPTASVVNISRGEIVDDEALLAALRNGSIAGAGLDAHTVEPLPIDSPWWTEPGVIITPHNGATTAATAARAWEIFVENVRRYAQGEPLHNVVDKTSGYAPR